jgi:hypothetical protein
LCQLPYQVPAEVPWPHASTEHNAPGCGNRLFCPGSLTALLLLLLLLLLFPALSHDRAFMERCCSRLLELDHGGFNTTHPFGGSGSYEAFKEVRHNRVVNVLGLQCTHLGWVAAVSGFTKLHITDLQLTIDVRLASNT